MSTCLGDSSVYSALLKALMLSSLSPSHTDTHSQWNRSAHSLNESEAVWFFLFSSHLHVFLSLWLCISVCAFTPLSLSPLDSCKLLLFFLSLVPSTCFSAFVLLYSLQLIWNALHPFLNLKYFFGIKKKQLQKNQKRFQFKSRLQVEKYHCLVVCDFQLHF